MLLATHNLCHQYPGQKTIFFPDIACEKSSSTIILGQSGSGKSTLLHILGGLMKPSGGQVKISGTDLYDLSAKQLDAFRGKHIGIVFQQAHYLKALTVAENLRLTQKLGGQKQDKQRINTVLDRLAILHKSNQKPQSLSIGEQQRFSIARAILLKPSIVLADEPTSALDDKNCKKVIELLQEQAEYDQAALLIVTHDHRISQQFGNQIELSSLIKDI